MKLTTKQLRQMIVEELNEIYKGKNRTIYAPGPVKLTGKEQEYYPGGSKYRIPRETGAYILPDEDPYDKLDPSVKDTIPSDSDEEMLRLAYQLSDSLGLEHNDTEEDFVYGSQVSNDPDKIVRDAIEALKNEIERLKQLSYQVLSRQEHKELAHRVRDAKIRMRRLQHYKTLDRAYVQSGAVWDI